MTDAFWPAPAKINLFLHVTGRRADGYHLLQTVFQFLDYCDEICFFVRRDDRISRSTDCRDINADDDLTVRAARALRDTAGKPLGVDIEVRKRIPIGGGLGGGSSDAATTLVALNFLWGLGLDTGDLARIGLSLGADVPVFVHGRAAWAEGVGESLTPMALPERWYLVVDPGCRIATAEIFHHPDLTRNSAPITIRDFLAGTGVNGCEPVVRRLHSEVGTAIDWLRSRGDARMSGTGSCIFLPFESERGARALHAELPRPWTGFVARGINRSPLLDRLGRQLTEVSPAGT